MGTPAFPDLGKHCSVSDCQLLDFLPFTCDSCHQVFCLDHRSYGSHHCPNANKHDVTVVICPLCAKGVRLIPDENPNITWESHVNTDCDPSNYEKRTKKKKCPVLGCKEILTFSNKIKCRDCSIEHCLKKHRFGPDHKCPGPKKQEATYQFMNLFNVSKKEEPRQAPVTSSSKWTTNLLKAASSIRATAEAGMTKLSNDLSQALSFSGEGQSSNNRNGSGNGSGQVEQCPICNLRFASVTSLLEHVQKVHQQSGVMNVTLDVCPKCSKGFRDPVALVEHVERDHAGMSKS